MRPNSQFDLTSIPAPELINGIIHDDLHHLVDTIIEPGSVAHHAKDLFWAHSDIVKN